MTTIVCSLKAMAGDTRVSWTEPDGRITTAYGTKVVRIGSALVGTAGDYAAGVRFQEWIAAGRPKKRPKLAKDFCALVLEKGGIFRLEAADATFMPVGPHFAAVGSGAPYALGALEAGATLQQAVEIAKKYDAYTGGDVTSLDL